MKALALKKACKASLKYAKSPSHTCLGVRMPKSTLHHWEVKRGDVVEKVLKELFRPLTLMDYGYPVIGSTKVADWLRGLHEPFINVRVRSATRYPPSPRSADEP